MKIKVKIFLNDYLIRSLYNSDSDEPIVSDGNLRDDWIYWRKFLILYPNGKESYDKITPSYTDLRNELLKNEI